MRTQDQIVEWYESRKGADWLGFIFGAAADFLDAEHIRPYCKDGADLSDWSAKPLTSEAVVDHMRDYMEFAWEKAIGERGISAQRSLHKFGAWLAILGDDEMSEMALGDYDSYGKPILRAICDKYGFPVPLAA